MFCMDWYRKVQNGQQTSWIACGCGDDSVRVWSSEDQPPKILRFPESSKNVVVDVSFSPNGKHLAAVDQKGFLVVWSDWVKVFSDQMFCTSPWPGTRPAPNWLLPTWVKRFSCFKVVWPTIVLTDPFSGDCHRIWRLNFEWWTTDGTLTVELWPTINRWHYVHENNQIFRFQFHEIWDK